MEAREGLKASTPSKVSSVPPPEPKYVEEVIEESRRRGF